MKYARKEKYHITTAEAAILTAIVHKVVMFTTKSPAMAAAIDINRTDEIKLEAILERFTNRF